MDFEDRVKALATRTRDLATNAQTEEAAKNALVMPFLQTLGYDVFDPTEVVPEFTADVGVKKGEKVDYAVMRDGEPIILVECKPVATDLDINHMSQLFRYFTVTPARVSVLTNGLIYQFFTDLEERNKMDQSPFMTIDMREPKPNLVPELRRLSKDAFDVEEIIAAATELKYTRALRRYLAKEFSHPDDDFLRFLIGHIYSGRITERVRTDFAPIVKRALRQFLNQLVNERLRSAMVDVDAEGSAAGTEQAPSAPTEPAPMEAIEDDGIITTEDEYEAYLIVRAILAEVVEPSRIAIRDVQSYCGVLLDDNNRKPITRLHFNRVQYQISLFKHLGDEKQEDRVPIDSPRDIYKHSATLRATVKAYLDEEDDDA